jgi:hypothetical protein
MLQSSVYYRCVQGMLHARQYMCGNEKSPQRSGSFCSFSVLHATAHNQCAIVGRGRGVSTRLAPVVRLPRSSYVSTHRQSARRTKSKSGEGRKIALSASEHNTSLVARYRNVLKELLAVLFIANTHPPQVHCAGIVYYTVFATFCQYLVTKRLALARPSLLPLPMQA